MSTPVADPPVRSIVTVDLDSTVADTEHRFHLIDRTRIMDWHAYAMSCTGDTVVAGVAALIKVCETAGHEVHYVSGRHEGSRGVTVAWLQEHLHETHDVSERLHLDNTPQGNHVLEFGSHAAYKVHMIQSLAARLGVEVLFHVDDHASVCEALGVVGIPAICVRAPYEVRALAAQDTLTAANEATVIQTAASDAGAL